MTDTVNTGTPLVSGGSRKVAKEIEVLARYCADVKSLRSRSKHGSFEPLPAGREPANKR
jgi:hypothetical protein